MKTAARFTESLPDEKPVRILHLIDTLAAGGAERQLTYLLENLDRRRFEPHVLTIYDEHRHYEPTLRALGIPLYSLHHGELWMQNRAWAVGRYVRLMWKLRPDVVHGWLHYANLIARCARPLCPSHRLVTAIRSQYSARQQRSEKLTSWLSDFRVVITPNSNPLNDKKHKTYLIPNSIPLANSQTIYSRQNLFPNTSFLTLTPARIAPNKGHITLIKALATLKTQLPPGFQAALIGEITSTQTQQTLERAIEQFQLQTIISQLPATHNISHYYQAADLIILPSDSEAFSNVILESFAAGKPIITSQAANTVQLVIHGENGWMFPTGDANALAQCLTEALTLSPEQRAEMGHKGRERIAKYSIERMVTQYSQLYMQLVTRS